MSHTSTSINIDSCEAREEILVSTRSSVYELIVLPGDQGSVSVRGGRHFPDFRPVLLLGSLAADGSLEPRTIDVGLRMKFAFGDRFVVTSQVQSLCRIRPVPLPLSVPPPGEHLDVPGESRRSGAVPDSAAGS